MSKRNLLFVGDACCYTGFARVTHNIIPYLQENWNVSVLGINYRGDPHKYSYPIYPAVAGAGSDMWGLSRVASIAEKTKADVVLINNDPWIALQFIRAVKLPVVTYMPVDGLNAREDFSTRLSEAALNIFYTRFGLNEYVKSGLTGHAAVIPHGVDSKLYRPMSKKVAREALGRPVDGYVVGCVNRNQPRKRLDLTISAFANWVKDADLPDDVFLHLHCRLNDIGWDLAQLSRYYGVADRVVFTDPIMEAINGGIDESVMPAVYNSFDVQISTSMGEGWGLTTHEGMACGIPQIVPDYAALGEWAKDAVSCIEIASYQASTGRVNTIGGIIDEAELVMELDNFWRKPDLRQDMGKAARECAIEPQYSWDSVGYNISNLLMKVVKGTLNDLEPRDTVESNSVAEAQQTGV